MGQKVHSLGFRLNSRKSWNLIWVDNKLKVNEYFFKTIQVNNFLYKLNKFYNGYHSFSFFLHFRGNINVYNFWIDKLKFNSKTKLSLKNKTIKKLNFDTYFYKKKFFNSKLAVKNVFLNDFNSTYKKNKKFELKKISPFFKPFNINLLKKRLNQLKILKTVKTNETRIYKNNLLKFLQKFTKKKKVLKIFSFFSANFLALYFMLQIEKNQKEKNYWFKRGLSIGVKGFLKDLFVKKPYLQPNGIKIIFLGRWAKTKTGRKQILKINFGSLKKQKIQSFIDYASYGGRTKFGAFCVHVFISRNIKN